MQDDDTPNPDPTVDLTDEEAAELARLRVVMGFIDEDEIEHRLIDGRYRLIKLIGWGGMGRVYRVHDLKLDDENVALKLVRTSGTRDLEQLRTRLEEEAKAMAGLRRHPNVVGLYEVGTHEECSYFTMEYVPGRDLRRWCSDHDPTREQILRLYLSAGRGLAAAHARGIVHRDFKPDNVLVTEDGIARVADFGVAAATIGLGNDEPGAPHIGGTRPYMPPEQVLKERSDARSDQFSFCVSVWESLCGKRPYTWQTHSEQLEALANRPRGGEQLPRWLRETLERGMSAERTARFHDMAELLAVIEGRLERPRRIKRAVAMGGGALLVAGAAALAVIVSRPKPPPAQTCEDFAALVDAHWSPSHRAALEARRSLAPESLDYAVDKLDELSDAWKQAARTGCVRQEAPHPRARQRACLEDWLPLLDQAVELLSSRGDAKTLAAAPDLLESLVPPEGDYCALPGQSIEEPELRKLVAGARQAALIGDRETAEELSSQALARAAKLVGEHGYTAEEAEAHAARAEVLARRGDFEEAENEYMQAEAHALGSKQFESLARTWILWAKGWALSQDQAAAREAMTQLERVAPLFVAQGLPENSLLRGDLIEATALANQYLGRSTLAEAGYRESAAFFVRMGHPLLAARSTYNRGALAHMSGKLAEAEAAYHDALSLLDGAGAPPSFPYRLHIEYNLGLLALDQFWAGEDPGLAQQFGRTGLDHLQVVIDHAPAEDRLDALGLATQLAAETRLMGEARAYAGQALLELDRSVIPKPMRDTVESQVALSLLMLGDSRGEPMVRELVERPATLDQNLYWLIARSWVEFLEDEGRCEEARQELAGLTNLEDIEEFREWRSLRPGSTCS